MILYWLIAWTLTGIALATGLEQWTIQNVLVWITVAFAVPVWVSLFYKIADKLV